MSLPHDPGSLPARIRARRMMTWLTVVAICMLFAGWISAYLVSSSAGYWTRITLPVAFVYSTLMVLAGSLTIHLALLSGRTGERGRTMAYLVATFVFGLAFTAFQFSGYAHLVKQGVHVSPDKMLHMKGEYGTDFSFLLNAEPIVLENGGYYAAGDMGRKTKLNADLEEQKDRTGPYLYVLTFMHLVHLFFGLLSVLIMILMAARRNYTPENHVGLWAGAVYWHFLGGLWVVIFLFLSLVH